MDPMTLLTAFLLLLGVIATDTMLNPVAVQIDVSAPTNVYRDVIDQASLEDMFNAQLDKVAATASVVHPPEIKSSSEQSIGLTLAESVKLKPVAIALQRQVGSDPDRLRFALFLDGKELRGVVAGHSKSLASFSQTFTQAPDETTLNLVQRAANWGAAQLAPYNTALDLLQRHGGDGDFRDVAALCEHAILHQPPAPVNPTRGQFENLQGLIALFRNDPTTARRRFEASAASWPGAPVPQLNLAFSELAADDYTAAAGRMHALLANMPSSHPAVFATAHLTLATALMGLHQYDEADAQLEQAMQVNPDSSAAADLWADLKQVRGDQAESARLRRLALQNSEKFENFGEMAALYFAMSWHDKEAVSRSKFSNPGALEFH